MKNLFTIMALFFIAAACGEKVTEGNFDFNGEVQLKHGEIVLSEDNNISLEIININDSRCPSDVICVWQGEARITFEFKNTIRSTFELNTNGPLKDTVDNYIFTLMEVDPYPVSTKTLKLDDYNVTLEIATL